MYPIRVQVAKPTTPRNRGTVAIRFLMVIPHAIVAAVWGIAASILTIGQWLLGVFTGKRHEGIFRFTRDYLGYVTRVSAYAALLHDQFPAFGTSDPQTPVAFANDFDPNANRLTVLLRYFTRIPATLIVGVWGIAAAVVAIGAWFSILFTGKMSDGMWDFLHRFVRYETAVNGYAQYLTTDAYPWPNAVG